ncbi:imidazolonepropionase-like domain-containing protein [Kitasatospora sp. NPDC052896]|uniref:imidazolonepropionase-like domain-containing protein n=1 Tax=Kitasatospora sp. NPDC052896 TaxID=3364061 RepID=UPI0037C62432
MLTLHRAAELRPAATAPSIPDGAVLVRGDEVAALGRYEELAAAHPRARVREWDGRLTPGLAHPYGGPLLEHRYHPDPREGLGEQPLPLPPGLDQAALGGSARRGLQRMLAHGTTALAGPFEQPAVRTAVSRSGLLVVVPFGPPFAGEPTGDDLPGFEAAVPYGVLEVGGRADFAVFGAGCLGTVLAGRLLFRRR